MGQEDSTQRKSPGPSDSGSTDVTSEDLNLHSKKPEVPEVPPQYPPGFVVPEGEADKKVPTTDEKSASHDEKHVLHSDRHVPKK